MSKDIDNKIMEQLLQIPAEDNTIEFKRLGDGNAKTIKIIESIVALANADGGMIILGIDDPEKTKYKGMKRVFGIEENKENYDEVGRLIQNIIPPLINIWPPMLIESVNNKTVAIIKIDKTLDNFHSLDKHVYIRSEKSNKKLSPHEIVNLSYAKGFSCATDELVDVDFGLLKTIYYEQWRKKRGIVNADIKQVLTNTGLAKINDKGILMPKFAAVLLFALYPNDLTHHKCAVRFFQYEGTSEIISKTPNLIGNPKTIGGPIIEQIKNAHAYVLQLLQAGIKMPASGFVTQYVIPERAIKEALTNAIIHRDYHIKRDIEVKIFEDRVQVESPGLLPANITVSNIGLIRAEKYRNDLLVKHLREFPDPPNLDQNEGIKAMRATMKESNLYDPYFFTYPTLPDSVLVILRNIKRPSEWDKVSNYLQKQKQFVTNTDVRTIIGNQDTVKVSRLLSLWVKQGSLIKETAGSKKTTSYRLPNSLADYVYIAMKRNPSWLFANKNQMIEK